MGDDKGRGCPRSEACKLVPDHVGDCDARSDTARLLELHERLDRRPARRRRSPSTQVTIFLPPGKFS